MDYNKLNNFQRMEEPEEREAEDLVHKKAKKKFRKADSSKSVSLNTFRFGTSLAALLVWVVFLSAIGFVSYKLITMFTGE